MISVVWDHTLPALPVETAEEAEARRWDEWFACVGLAKEWGKIKEACQQVGYGHKELMGWARITELTRLGRYECGTTTPER